MLSLLRLSWLVMALTAVGALVALETLRGGAETGGLLVDGEPVLGVTVSFPMALGAAVAAVAGSAGGGWHRGTAPTGAR